jgi:alpha 1,3-glucosidase
LYHPKRFVGTNDLYDFWVDMNEPSVFDGEQFTMPYQNIHQNMIDLDADEYQDVLHRDLHNAYGIMAASATYEALKKRNALFVVEKTKARRPFILTRSYFIGSQKYGAFWTGDNSVAISEHKINFEMMLTSGLVGFGHSGFDVPGFDGTPSKESVISAYQLGIFMPFFRAHSHLDYKKREPWLYEDTEQTIIREAIEMRYKLFFVL